LIERLIDLDLMLFENCFLLRIRHKKCEGITPFEDTSWPLHNSHNPQCFLVCARLKNPSLDIKFL
jgi:hypothetical protein